MPSSENGKCKGPVVGWGLARCSCHHKVLAPKGQEQEEQEELISQKGAGARACQAFWALKMGVGVSHSTVGSL